MASTPTTGSPAASRLLGADDRVQRQGERGHELEQTFAEELALAYDS